MATTGSALMTWEQFEELPDGDGCHRELLEGELQVLPPAKLGHSRVAARAFIALVPLRERGLGEVLAEAGFKLPTTPTTWLQPDVSFVRKKRQLTADETGYQLGAPDLAVEVISPSESAADVQRKVQLYLAAGCHAVWAIYSQTKKVVVSLPDGTAHTRGLGDVLEAPFLDPGWRLPVAKLFED